MWSTLRVLLVDDDPAIRDILRTLFEAAGGWEIAGEAADGLEAIRLATETQPDAVILDYMMPEMSGMDALPAIVRAAPSAKVVLLTAHPGARDLLDAAALGAACTMEKTALLQVPQVVDDILATAGR